MQIHTLMVDKSNSQWMSMAEWPTWVTLRGAETTQVEMLPICRAFQQYSFSRALQQDL